MHTSCHLGCKHEMNILTVGIPQVVCASRETKTSSCIADQPPLRQVYFVNSTSLNPNQPGLIKNDQTSSKTMYQNHASPSEYISSMICDSFLKMFSINTPCCAGGVLQQTHRSLDVEEGEPSAPRSHVACLSDGERILQVPIKTKIPMFNTWWLIPLSKWVITPVLNGISRVNPLITGVITHLLSGMSHQVGHDRISTYP